MQYTISIKQKGKNSHDCLNREKAFVKTQHPFMIKKKKSFNKLGKEGNLLILIKGM